MHGTLQRRAEEARETVRPVDRETDHLVDSVLKDIARSLWPTNTAANLASEIGCEVRTAERYLGGQRDWSGDAVAAIVQEIMARHKQRNIRIAKRF